MSVRVREESRLEDGIVRRLHSGDEVRGREGDCKVRRRRKGRKLDKEEDETATQKKTRRKRTLLDLCKQERTKGKEGE